MKNPGAEAPGNWPAKEFDLWRDRALAAGGHDHHISIDRDDGPGRANDNRQTARTLIQLRKITNRYRGFDPAACQSASGSRNAPGLR
jgi:hypothetical protein